MIIIKFSSVNIFTDALFVYSAKPNIVSFMLFPAFRYRVVSKVATCPHGSRQNNSGNVSRLWNRNPHPVLLVSSCTASRRTSRSIEATSARGQHTELRIGYTAATGNLALASQGPARWCLSPQRCHGCRYSLASTKGERFNFCRASHLAQTTPCSSAVATQLFRPTPGTKSTSEHAPTRSPREARTSP